MPNGFFGKDLSDPKTLAIMGMAQGLLSASGVHDRPVNMGEALGMGLQSGMGGFVTGNQLQNQRAQANWLNSMRQQKQDMIKQGLLRKQYLQSMGLGMGGQATMPQSDNSNSQLGPMIPGMPQIGTMPGGNQIPAPATMMIPTTRPSTPVNSGGGMPLPSLPQGGAQGQVPDQAALIRQLIGSGDPELMSMAKQFADMQPKVKDNVQVMVGGKPMYQPIFEDGTYGQISPNPVAAELNFADIGGKNIGRNKFTGDQISSVNTSMSPYQSAQIGIEREKMKTQGQPTPAGYRYIQDGSLEAIPGGPADPNGKATKLSEIQSRAQLFGSRAQAAHEILNSLEGKYSPMAVNAKMAAGDTFGIGGPAGFIGNKLLTDSGQKAEQAQRDFANAILRLESGAVIGEPEFKNAQKQYFPQPGDLPATLLQKSQNRERAIKGLDVMSGPAGGFSPNGKESAVSGGGWSAKIVR